jgi:hypothetical protein
MGGKKCIQNLTRKILKWRNILRDLGVDGKIVSKRIFKKQNVMTWTGLKWLKIAYGSVLNHVYGNEASDSIILGNFLRNWSIIDQAWSSRTMVRYAVTTQKTTIDIFTALRTWNIKYLFTSLQREISGSHGGEYEYGCLLGCCIVQSGLFSSSWWWRQQAPLKRRWTSTRLHGATIQKTAIFKLTWIYRSNYITKVHGLCWIGSMWKTNSF